mmetsp:Transcript_7370/g.26726  ORF Transcript_7370/g.26726 Transcript_7370/m.26726 type:complete len:294 (+) Transcript_7370:171-1052(+)
MLLVMKLTPRPGLPPPKLFTSSWAFIPMGTGLWLPANQASLELPAKYSPSSERYDPPKPGLWPRLVSDLCPAEPTLNSAESSFGAERAALAGCHRYPARDPTKGPLLGRSTIAKGSASMAAPPLPSASCAALPMAWIASGPRSPSLLACRKKVSASARGTVPKGWLQCEQTLRTHLSQRSQRALSWEWSWAVGEAKARACSRPRKAHEKGAPWASGICALGWWWCWQKWRHQCARRAMASKATAKGRSSDLATRLPRWSAALALCSSSAFGSRKASARNCARLPLLAAVRWPA